MAAATSRTSLASRQTLRMPSCSSLFRIDTLRLPTNFYFHVSLVQFDNLDHAHLLAIRYPTLRIIWMPYFLRDRSSRAKRVDRS